MRQELQRLEIMNEEDRRIVEKMSSAFLVYQERGRQMEVEGYSPQDDDKHVNGELARAAACYAVGAPDLWFDKGTVRECPGSPFTNDPRRIPVWPFDLNYWKPEPNDRIRELVKAGALILAEIDRLERTKK